MTSPGSQAQLYQELLDRYGQEIADAFLRAMSFMRSAVQYGRIVDALERGDIEGAINELGLDLASYEELRQALQRAYLEGGQATEGAIPRRAGVSFRFSLLGNPRAERWIGDHSSSLITRINDDTRQAVRSTLRDALAQGVNPRSAAIRIVGTVDPRTGRREGGVLGLTAAQERYVTSARGELASGEATDLRAYLGRELRDRRFDRSIAKAIRDGEPLPADIQRKAVLAYERRLLAFRGKLIGQVESFNALAAGRDESFRQLIDSGKVRADQITKIWRHFPNANPREQHIAMRGKTVGFDEMFILPDGTRMRFAHDPAAPIKHLAGCHCQTDYRVDWLAGVT